MKKFLSIIAAVGLTATTSTAVVACGQDDDYKANVIDTTEVKNKIINYVENNITNLGFDEQTFIENVTNNVNIENISYSIDVNYENLTYKVEIMPNEGFVLKGENSFIGEIPLLRGTLKTQATSMTFPDTIWGMAQLENGNYMIAQANGSITIFDKNFNLLKEVETNVDQVLSMRALNNNDIIIATNYKLIILKDDGTIKKEIDLKNEENEEIIGNYFRDILEIEGKLYIATDQWGLLKLNAETYEFEETVITPDRFLEDEYLLSLEILNPNEILIGTALGNVYHFNFENNTLTKKQIFENQSRIHDLVLIDNNVLITGPSGIVSINVNELINDDNSLITYITQKNNLEFSTWGMMKANDNDLIVSIWTDGAMYLYWA